MKEHVRVEHKELQPILLLYIIINDEGLAECDFCDGKDIEIDDVGSYMEGSHGINGEVSPSGTVVTGEVGSSTMTVQSSKD